MKILEAAVKIYQKTIITNSHIYSACHKYLKAQSKY